MKKKITYTDEPMGKGRVVKDFLPSPDKLVLREENTKVTMMLSKASVDFFKNTAKKNHTHYQKMIRSLLDTYALQFR